MQRTNSPRQNHKKPIDIASKRLAVLFHPNYSIVLQ